MSDYKFFDIDGNEFEGEQYERKSEFVGYYSTMYYEKPEGSAIRNELGTTRTPEAIENEIDLILKEGVKKRVDVVRIMAWKMGEAKYDKSKNEIKYFGNSEGKWENIGDDKDAWGNEVIEYHKNNSSSVDLQT